LLSSPSLLRSAVSGSALMMVSQNVTLPKRSPRSRTWLCKRSRVWGRFFSAQRIAVWRQTSIDCLSDLRKDFEVDRKYRGAVGTAQNGPYPDIGQERWSRQPVSRPAQLAEPEVSSLALVCTLLKTSPCCRSWRQYNLDASVELLRIALNCLVVQRLLVGVFWLIRTTGLRI